MEFIELRKKIKKNYTSHDLIVIMPGILANIVFNKNKFQRNIELKSFTDIFDNEYANYLFKARPLLYSRLIKEFIEISEEKEIYKYTNEILQFLEMNIKEDVQEDKQENLKEIQVKQKKNSTTKNIESWGKIINPGRYNDDKK